MSLSENDKPTLNFKHMMNVRKVYASWCLLMVITLELPKFASMFYTGNQPYKLFQVFGGTRLVASARWWTMLHTFVAILLELGIIFGFIYDTLFSRNIYLNMIVSLTMGFVSMLLFNFKHFGTMPLIAAIVTNWTFILSFSHLIVNVDEAFPKHMPKAKSGLFALLVGLSLENWLTLIFVLFHPWWMS